MLLTKVVIKETVLEFETYLKSLLGILKQMWSCLIVFYFSLTNIFNIIIFVLLNIVISTMSCFEYANAFFRFFCIMIMSIA